MNFNLTLIMQAIAFGLGCRRCQSLLACALFGLLLERRLALKPLAFGFCRSGLQSRPLFRLALERRLQAGALFGFALERRLQSRALLRLTLQRRFAFQAVALGLDWVVIDAEHGHLDWKEIVEHLRAATVAIR